MQKSFSPRRGSRQRSACDDTGQSGGGFLEQATNVQASPHDNAANAAKFMKAAERRRRASRDCVENRVVTGARAASLVA
jgi:hypothetical protein